MIFCLIFQIKISYKRNASLSIFTSIRTLCKHKNVKKFFKTSKAQLSRFDFFVLLNLHRIISRFVQSPENYMVLVELWSQYHVLSA